ncbi:MAG: hypothetical protein IPI65_13090 [Bacteroidetes bacterium]|nr:hypothetical protein [Bacteroidota bacterium]
MKKKVKSISSIILFGLIVIIYSCKSYNEKGSINQSKFEWIDAKPKFDTSFSKNSVVTKIKFLDKYCFNTNFIVDENFSFLNPESLSDWSISISNKKINLNTDSIDWAYYFFDTDSVLMYENELGSFLIITNQPFYCNGFSCNVIGLLVLGESSQGSVAYYFDTEFVDKEVLIDLIVAQTSKNNRLSIPMSCPEKDSKIEYIYKVI